MDFSKYKNNEKEKKWIEIYNNIKIEKYLDDLLFKKKLDEKKILDELETLSKII
jgi:hypothetical protein